NIELAKAIDPHRDFFAGVAVLNPLYPAWERDLETCAGKLGLKALRLVPQYHNYRLDCPEVLVMVQKAANLKLPVFIPQRLVDVRGRHWMDTEQTINLCEVGVLCRAAPETKVVFTEAAVNPEELVDKRGRVSYPNLYFEMSRFRSVLGQNIKRMVQLIGHERVLFGSGAPFKEITPALLKLQHAALSPKEKNAVALQNAVRILRIS
ncbi:MAG: amidohydrolase family protein, partial [Verrucomicrobiota bacterium]